MTRSLVPTTFWQETRATALLALPIIFGQILQHSLTVIDTIMVGQVSVEGVAAGALATALFVVPLVFGFGVMGPFSVFVSAAFARGETEEGVHHLRRGLLLSVFLAVALAVAITAFSGYLNLLDQPASVLVQARSFLLLLSWSIVPMYLFQMLKQYCEALHTAWPPMVILTFGMFINIALNWVFIYGHWGAPAMGLVGAGWATLITRTIMLIALAMVVRRIHFRAPELRRAFFTGSFHWQGYKDLLRTGVPAGFQVTLEVGAFTFAAVMMGWISDHALAAHQIAISIAAMTFMVPLGLSMAVAIRVGHAVGADDMPRARLSARSSLFMTVTFMSMTAIIIFIFAHGLASLFIRDQAVVLLATRLLFVAALFQIFDGLQVTCVGALRGLHDITVPTLINFGGYWLVGLPISYLIAFHWHHGAMGIWWGLLIGMGFVAGSLVLRLTLKLRQDHCSYRSTASDSCE
jgi:MATE family multidrug resistance protein